jgi:hypothetical protein
MTDVPRPKKAETWYPVVPFSGMAEMQDVPRGKYLNLFSYISRETRAHYSISDAVALVLLNQFLSIPDNFYSQNGAYTRSQRGFNVAQLKEFLGSMRVLEIFFTRPGFTDGGTGLFRGKTVVTSYTGQVVKVPPQGFDIVFLSYNQRSIPDKKSLEEERFGELSEGKYAEELDALTDPLRPPLLTKEEDALLNTIMTALEHDDGIKTNSGVFYALAARYDEESDADAELKNGTIARIRAVGDLAAKIESEVESTLGLLPDGPKGFIESIAIPAVGKRGALIVSSDARDTPLDTFRTIKSFGDGSLVLYQRND